MVTALVSLLSGRPVRPMLAMTGEISLSGFVLPVGGIKEKVLGAKRAGIREVILPAENESNVKEDLLEHLPEGMQIHYVRTLDEALDRALTPVPSGVSLGAARPPQAPAPASPGVH
jgi:ATP-dependent Lon protease